MSSDRHHMHISPHLLDQSFVISIVPAVVRLTVKEFFPSKSSFPTNTLGIDSGTLTIKRSGKRNFSIRPLGLLQENCVVISSKIVFWIPCCHYLSQNRPFRPLKRQSCYTTSFFESQNFARKHSDLRVNFYSYNCKNCSKTEVSMYFVVKYSDICKALHQFFSEIQKLASFHCVFLK